MEGAQGGLLRREANDGVGTGGAQRSDQGRLEGKGEGPSPPVCAGESGLISPAIRQEADQVLRGGSCGAGMRLWRQAHRKGVPILDVAGDPGSIPGACQYCLILRLYLFNRLNVD